MNVVSYECYLNVICSTIVVAFVLFVSNECYISGNNIVKQFVVIIMIIRIVRGARYNFKIFFDRSYFGLIFCGRNNGANF